MPEGIPYSKGPMALSPDGQRLAAGVTGGLLVHSLDGLDPVLVPLPDRSGPVNSVAWSEDSREVVYSVSGEIRRFPYPGGDHLLVAETEGYVGALAVVGPTVFYTAGTDTVFWRASLRGGVPESMPAPEDGSHFHDLQPIHGTDLLLGSRHWQQTVDGVRENSYWVSIISPDGHQDLMEQDYSDGTFCLVGDHIVMERGTEEKRALWAFPFSHSTRELTGGPFFLWPGRSPLASRDGDLVYASGAPRKSQLAWLDREWRDRVCGSTSNGGFLAASFPGRWPRRLPLRQGGLGLRRGPGQRGASRDLGGHVPESVLVARGSAGRSGDQEDAAPERSWRPGPLGCARPLDVGLPGRLPSAAE